MPGKRLEIDLQLVHFKWPEDSHTLKEVKSVSWELVERNLSMIRSDVCCGGIALVD